MNLLVAFFHALFFALFGSAFLPGVVLMAFAPFLALTFQRRRFVPSLWIAFGCGLIMDLVSSSPKLGVYVINYLLLTILLYKQKRYFFDDKPLALALFSALISAVSTVLQFMLLWLWDQNPAFSWKFIFTDFLVMPLFDALYAFVWFICPMKLYMYIQSVGIKKLFYRRREQEE